MTISIMKIRTGEAYLPRGRRTCSARSFITIRITTIIMIMTIVVIVLSTLIINYDTLYAFA